ncbi:BglG family transcription antiterminator LicT [Clostridium sp. MB05]|uniref:BglG family transcription antiterminator LicT n=1 Tax=Clostridium sp. MB05 TaxID=3376682 RepID=UPI003982C24D
MIIHKVLNNNAITILNDNNEETVVMGRGIAFQKKKGDEIDKSLINKIFILENKLNTDKLINLISEIPIEYIQIAEEIISYAENKLEKKLNENIYLTLTDHISFSVTRYRENTLIRNSMLWDIKRLYKQEFLIGIKALEIIKEKVGIQLPEDEAASIALHILNGQLNKDIPEIVDMMNIVQEILDITKYSLNIDFDEETLNYYRFVTHLKFFAERIFNNSYYEDTDNDLYYMIINKYPRSFKCSKKIKEFIAMKYGNNITKEELLYLTIHIERVVQKK